MIINKNKPVSLSMRMRTEAAKLPPEGKGLRSSMGSEGSNSSLPEIGMGTSASSHNLKLSSTYSLTISKKPKDPSLQELEVERASGIIDYVSSGGVFADRTKMTMPVASCVRCGEHASTCMSCTEFLAEESLNFYRKTRARGAASLFANAITQTGVTVVVKYVIFCLWKNGFRNRKWALRKRDFQSNVRFRNHFMKYTFKGWVTYTTKILVERRDKRIEELEKRVVALEAATTQATNLKANAEASLRKVQSEKDGFLSTIAKQEAKIALLESALQRERSRVVGLSSLTLPVLSFEEVTARLSTTAKTDVHRGLFLAAASQLPAFDYGKTFNAEDVETLVGLEAKRRAKGQHMRKAESLDEEVELVEMLLNWASTKSRDAGSNQDHASGKTLDNFLPKHKKAGTFDDFKNGVVLLRLVVGLLWDMPQPGHTTLKLAIPTGMEAVPPREAGKDGDGASAGAAGASVVFNQEQVLAEIKAAQKTPFEMITCAVDLAQRYLALPSFQVGDLVACRPEIYTALLGYLMLASASPAQSANSLAKVSSLINAFEKAAANAEYAKHQITLKEVRNIQRAWAVVHGLPDEQPAQSSADVSGEIITMSSSSSGVATAAEEPEAESVPEERKGAEAADNKSSSESAAAVAAEEPLTDAMTKYQKLAAAVDAYMLSMLGAQNPEDFTFASADVSPLPGQIKGYGESMEELVSVKTELHEHQQRADAGFRLGTKARTLMSRFQLELLANELKWLE